MSKELKVKEIAKQYGVSAKETVEKAKNVPAVRPAAVEKTEKPERIERTRKALKENSALQDKRSASPFRLRQLLKKQ